MQVVVLLVSTSTAVTYLSVLAVEAVAVDQVVVTTVVELLMVATLVEMDKVLALTYII